MAQTDGTAFDPERFERIVFFTGAGLSAEAGLPTYRGSGGIWDAYDWQRYACQTAFEQNPERVWDFHDVRRKHMGKAAPTTAHQIIAAVGAERPGTVVVTQNIDGLHQRAGSPHVIELHGSVWRVRCACGPEPQENFETPIQARTCPACEAWRRPDITWFGDALAAEPVRRAIDAIQHADLLIGIGTSGVVYPAAELPRLARDAGATLVEINPDETAVSSWYGIHMREGASQALTRLFRPAPDSAGPPP